MRFHGGTDVDEVLDAMDYAVYANDVEHIILDNLQFMLTRDSRDGRHARLGPFDKFDAQVRMTSSRTFLALLTTRILRIHAKPLVHGGELSVCSGCLSSSMPQTSPHYATHISLQPALYVCEVGPTRLWSFRGKHLFLVRIQYWPHRPHAMQLGKRATE